MDKIGTAGRYAAMLRKVRNSYPEVPVDEQIRLSLGESSEPLPSPSLASAQLLELTHGPLGQRQIHAAIQAVHGRFVKRTIVPNPAPKNRIEQLR